MNRKKLFKDLNQLCLELQDKYNINNGGCCYVAACIAEQLELHCIPFQVIHYNLFHCHYCVKVYDRYINRDGYKKYEISDVLICSAKDIFRIYREGDWNYSYDIRYNSIVKKSIKRLFTNYENSRT